MAGRISFPMKDLELVVAQFNTEGVSLVPTGDCIFNAALYPDGKIVDKNGLTEKQAEKIGAPWWPDHTKIDKTKLTPKLMIVGDHGVYAMANVDNPQNTDDAGTPRKAVVAYGLGCNPDKDDDFYENKARIFGDDDGAVSIDLSWYEVTKKAGKANMTIQFNARSIRLVQ